MVHDCSHPLLHGSPAAQQILWFHYCPASVHLQLAEKKSVEKWAVTDAEVSVFPMSKLKVSSDPQLSSSIDMMTLLDVEGLICFIFQTAGETKV